MNGDEKEEAHRPRPLSAGIWTLFSWLRRNERSSSSESVSSVGSARTAVSFDFLAPGNYNFKNTPIVLTTPLNPPTETYKRRLQDRNLRRQRDRDVTLHRKYGLYREHENGYDGFTLPPLRRTLGNTGDRPNRERRATSECLQRRAAYVPGKRRAPLPPAITTSASLPRTYKRKRPAPKPPIKNTFEDNNNIVQLTNNPVRMTSNSESEAKFVPEIEPLNSSKTQKYDKKVTTSKDTKSRTDKNFLKHIFENRKRSSVVETTSVRLLPSISELDKQATEIIENNKLRQKINIVNPDDATPLYEVNSWFCISCLRKYNSSVDSCNYCLPDKKHSLKKDGLRMSIPRSSIYTQANINVETASTSRSSLDERKMLKEILKEMKDSLPKKNKDNKVNNVLTEIPTLRIGSTVQEPYKDFTSQSSSSDVINKNRILSISSLLSETQKNNDQKSISNQHILTGVKSLDVKKGHQYEVTSEYKNKSNVQSLLPTISSSAPGQSLAKDEHRGTNKSADHSVMLFDKSKKHNFQEIDIQKITEDKNLDNADLKNTSIIKNTSQTQTHLPMYSTKTNESKDIKKSTLQVLHETSSNILIGHPQYFSKDEIHLDNLKNNQNEDSSTLAVTNISTELEKVLLPKSSKLQFLNCPNSRDMVVNSVTVVTTHTKNKSSEISKKISGKNTGNNSMQTNMSKEQNETKITDIPIHSPFQRNSSPAKNVTTTNNQTYLETKPKLVKSPEKSIDNAKSEYNLHTPLNISSLLNPLYSQNKSIVKENMGTKADDSKHFQKELPSNSNALKTINIDKVYPKVNKTVLENILPATNSTDLKSTYPGNDVADPQIRETVKIEPHPKNVTLKDVSYEQKVLPSTSGCSSGITKSNINVEKLDHYDRRRHLINQLEQSIAKGDEVAAAEAAVKLAKLKLSCSVLSFSSQIVGEPYTTKENKSDKQFNKLDTNTTSSKDKPIEQGIPQPLTSETTKDVDINKQIIKSDHTNDLIENNEISEKDATELDNESNLKSQVSTIGPSSSTQVIPEDIVSISVWIEDKQAARGPIRLNISRWATVADLRRQAEHSLGLATQLQRWIVGRTLCSDDTTPIISLAGPYLRAPFYLCIVQPDQNDKPKTNESINDSKNNNNATDHNGEFYTELMNLEKQSLVPNIEPFECGVCMEECAPGAGVILRECIHTFCRECLSDVVQHSQEPVVACPAMGCSGFLQEREIRTIVTSEEYERWLARSLATAECGTRNAFHCRTRDCTGWAFCDPGVRRFPCPVCKNTNCVQCQAIHEGQTCEDYQAKLRQAVTVAETYKDDEGTQALLNSLMSRGEALECPECRAIITKKWGCDWVKCSACKTEICWITKGRRWGPSGRGDTSGGCRCGVDGQRCHPSCGYCH